MPPTLQIGQRIRLTKPATTLCHAGAEGRSVQQIPAGAIGTIFYLPLPVRGACDIVKGLFDLPGQFTGTARRGDCSWITPMGGDGFEVLPAV